MTEQDLQTQIIKYITSLPGLAINGQFTKSGIPDLICLVQGRFIAIEVKLDYNKPSPLQAHYIKHIQSLGGLAIEAYSLDDVKQLIRANFPNLEKQIEI
jgi:hypothetical protein